MKRNPDHVQILFALLSGSLMSLRQPISANNELNEIFLIGNTTIKSSQDFCIISICWVSVNFIVLRIAGRNNQRHNSTLNCVSH